MDLIPPKGPDNNNRLVSQKKLSLRDVSASPTAHSSRSAAPNDQVSGSLLGSGEERSKAVRRHRCWQRCLVTHAAVLTPAVAFFTCLPQAAGQAGRILGIARGNCNLPGEAHLPTPNRVLFQPWTLHPTTFTFTRLWTDARSTWSLLRSLINPEAPLLLPFSVDVAQIPKQVFRQFCLPLADLGNGYWEEDFRDHHPEAKPLGF